MSLAARAFFLGRVSILISATSVWLEPLKSCSTAACWSCWHDRTSLHSIVEIKGSACHSSPENVSVM